MLEVFETPEVILLQLTPCIWYLVQFQESLEVQALINSNNKANTMILTYVAKLSLFIWEIYIRAQKTNRLTLVTYGMVIA